MEFYRNQKKSNQLVLIYVGLIVMLLGILLYSTGIIADAYLPKAAVISGIGVLVLTFCLIKSLIAAKDKSPMIALQPDGIVSRVTPVSKAAGLISWKDIQELSLSEMGADVLVTLHLSNVDHYKAVISKKLSKMAVSDSTDENGHFMVYLTASHIDCNAAELLAKINAYDPRNK
ncbi:STM3941 family protein [Pedobacter gandavensis]|uniref:STM3941 family protein n=1 Tax=Pedobacter gandavensis TaxID=2679963 RepID=UPI00293093E1|nr:STM3941 family protein [Pedobacter gandavensis]